MNSSPVSTVSQRTYRSSLNLGRLAMSAILVTSGSYAVTMIADGYGRMMFATWDDMDAEVSGNLESALLLSVGLVAILVIIGFVAAVVLYCMWLYRVACNARALGAQGLDFSPGKAVVGFFIPILNLFWPYKAVKEIWQASDPTVDEVHWRNADSSPVGWWWLFWIAGTIGGRIVDKLADRFSDPTTFALLLLHGLAFFVAGVLACKVIKGLIRRQDHKAGALERELAIEPISSA